ncbi:MarR family transcriptional regulator [bacterium]|nr:MarR family transcriptional regulator [bacterium]
MKDEMVRKDVRRIQDCLERIHRQLFSQVLGELNKVKVSVSQYNLLSFLVDEGVCTMTKAARCLYVTTSAVTAMTDGLVQKRMTRRRRSRRDRRIVEIAITDKGRKIVAKIRRQVENFYIPILKSLGKKDSRELVRLQEEMWRIMGVSGK